MSQVTLQGNASGTGIFTIAAPNSNTNRTLNLPDAGGAVIVGTQPAGDIVGTTATQTLTNKSISGAQINSGTVAVARLGSGSPSASNFLRGDGSWQTVSTTPTTAQVLTAYADATAGAVGTYAFAINNASTSVSTNGTLAGSSLRYAATTSNTNTVSNLFFRVGGALSGTWRLMGYADRTTSEGISFNFPSVWLRIS
jgi:hypothetical protein